MGKRERDNERAREKETERWRERGRAHKGLAFESKKIEMDRQTDRRTDRQVLTCPAAAEPCGG